MKIKTPKEVKKQKLKLVQKKLQKQQLAIIEAKYDVKIQKTLRAYNDKTMEELWIALDLLKEQMSKELEQLGIK